MSTGNFFSFKLHRMIKIIRKELFYVRLFTHVKIAFLVLLKRSKKPLVFLNVSHVGSIADFGVLCEKMYNNHNKSWYNCPMSEDFTIQEVDNKIKEIKNKTESSYKWRKWMGLQYVSPDEISKHPKFWIITTVLFTIIGIIISLILIGLRW